VLIIAILILLLAATSSIKHNYNYLAEYIKLNRIVLIIFILGAYIAYNALDVKAIGSGIGIYGGVFKVTILSQVFDIFLFIIGAIVTILVCFIPYNFSNFSDIKSSKLVLKKNIINSLNLFEEYSFFKSNFREYNFKDYFVNNNNNDNYNNTNYINIIKKLTELLPKIYTKTPFITKKDLIYSKLEVKEYSLLLLFTVFGGSLLISSQNLISLYLSLELQSFTLYILSTSQIKSFKGTSGGLKYFLLGGLSSGFILLGCSLLYAYTGTLNLEHIFLIYSNNVSNYFLDPCLLILFAGLLFKVSAAPFHN
jgi:NADH-ubiquinone oxidoreductase chain 2